MSAEQKYRELGAEEHCAHHRQAYTKRHRQGSTGDTRAAIKQGITGGKAVVVSDTF